MNAEEARDLFSEAFEGDLDEARQQAFQKALADDEVLAAEYEDFLDTFRIMDRIGEEPIEVPNLLPKIQERIRRRSRGRYYRDRFSQRIGLQWMLPVIASIALLFILAVAWYAIESAVQLDAGESTTEPEAPSEPAPSEP